MAWHIFRKDVRLLWRLAVGVSFMHFVATAGMFRQGHFGHNTIFPVPLLQLFQQLAFLAFGFLIVAVVHQDAIPGARQDWLVRPIRRRDLVLAKCLFILLLVHGPVFLADLAEALAAGFPLHQSLAASVSRSAYLFFSFSLPIWIFASLTRNFTEALAGGLMAFAGYVAFQLLSHSLYGDNNFVIGPGDAAAVAWITESLQLLLFLVGSAVILRLQYWRRKTWVARWLTVGIATLCLLMQYVPWQTVFAMEKSLSNDPAAAKNTSVSFDSGMGKFRQPSSPSFETTAKQHALRAAGMTSLSLPLHFYSLKANTVLKSDRSVFHLLSSDGSAISVNGVNDLEIHEPATGNSDARVWQTVYLPISTYNRIKDAPVRLEIDYSLTLLTLSSSSAISALNGDQRTPGVGWCKTRMNDAESHVDLSCIEVGNGPSCGAVSLEYVPSGERNPEVSSCAPDYAPYFRGSLSSGVLTRFGISLPFRDPAGLAPYPVDGHKLAESQVVLQTYRAADHFTLRLVIPEIRLRDWQAD